MGASANGKRHRRSAVEPSQRHVVRSPGTRMRDVPNVDVDDDFDLSPDRPFAGDVIDALDPDLRHRMVSETAHRRHGECGYDDGYDLDDWLQAEADLDHLLYHPRR